MTSGHTASFDAHLQRAMCISQVDADMQFALALKEAEDLQSAMCISQEETDRQLAIDLKEAEDLQRAMYISQAKTLEETDREIAEEFEEDPEFADMALRAQILRER
jgi:hypothetical protein